MQGLVLHAERHGETTKHSLDDTVVLRLLRVESHLGPEQR
jgi:hypothetical protein